MLDFYHTNKTGMNASLAGNGDAIEVIHQLAEILPLLSLGISRLIHMSRTSPFMYVLQTIDVLREDHEEGCAVRIASTHASL